LPDLMLIDTPQRKEGPWGLEGDHPEKRALLVLYGARRRSLRGMKGKGKHQKAGAVTPSKGSGRDCLCEVSKEQLTSTREKKESFSGSTTKGRGHRTVDVREVGGTCFGGAEPGEREECPGFKQRELLSSFRREGQGDLRSQRGSRE